MGKQNNQNNKKKKPNYFDQKIQQFGDEFMTKMTILDLKKDANRILKDIGFANIDFSNMKYLRYFSDPVFVQTLLQASYDNWNYNNMTCVGLENYFQSNQYTQTDMDIYDIHNMARQAYSIMYNGLNDLMSYLNRCSQTGSQIYSQPMIDILFIMSRNLLQYNKGINYTFIVVDDRRNYNDKRPRNNHQEQVQRVPDNGYSG